MKQAMLVVLFTVLTVASAGASPRSELLGPHRLSAAYVQKAAISPNLRPKSDKKFMNEDLPEDRRPSAEGLAFGHPYPIVQESNNYDKDFVNDQNEDDGHWKAQSEYDNLRIRIRKARKDVAEAKAVMNAEKDDVSNAEGASRASADELSKDEAESANARKSADDSHRTASEADSNSGNSRTAVADRGVSDAEADDEKSAATLEECKKELGKARARLAELMKEKEERDAARRAAHAARQAAYAKAKNAEDLEAGQENTVQEEKEEYHDAIDKHGEKMVLLKKAEENLAVAAKKLKKFRRDPHVDDDGGVYNVPDEEDAESEEAYHHSPEEITKRSGVLHHKSGASPAGAFAATVLATFAAFASIA